LFFGFSQPYPERTVKMSENQIITEEIIEETVTELENETASEVLEAAENCDTPLPDDICCDCCENVEEQTEAEPVDECIVTEDETCEPEESAIEETVAEDVTAEEAAVEEEIAEEASEPVCEEAPVDEIDPDFTFEIENGEAVLVKYHKHDAQVCVPATYDSCPVTVIAHQAFSGNNWIEKVTLPDTIKVIEGDDFGGAFRDCATLESINFPEGLVSIGQGAFYGCELLSSLDLPSTLEVIDRTAFCGCSNIIELVIPDTVKRVRKGAFSDCASLETLVIGKNVEYVSRKTFGGCDALVFAGTIGERSDEIRRFVTQKMGYLGFKLDNEKNENPVFEGRHALISTPDSKPIYIVMTDETDQMIYRAQAFLSEAE